MRKTEEILRLCLLAIEKEHKRAKKLSEKFQEAIDASLENAPKPPNEDFFEAKRLKNGKIELRTTKKMVRRLQEVVQTAVEFNDELKFHLHNILLVSIWTNFETYLQGMLFEFYQKHPDQMKSDRQVRYEELIDHRQNILDYLIDQEISDFGRRNFSEVRKYLRTRGKI